MTSKFEIITKVDIMRRTLCTLPRISRIHFTLILVASLAFSGALTQHTATTSEPSPSHPLIGNTSLSPAPIASVAPYDEQVGITFTQDFSTLIFNVSAVSYTDNNIGPGYLVNGLTDRGYWYQVGLSYNWPMTNGAVNPGFSMNYEVFAPDQSSIYPSNGGGIEPFNGTVNTGDSIQLSLSFSRGSVLMQAIDWQTRSVAIQLYASYANKNTFIGLQSSLANTNGFFSGLMTEQYHYYQYFQAGTPVTYAETGSRISSAWIWMDEWNTNTNQPVFKANTTALPLTDTLGQYFSSNGTAEIANAHKLVTGLTPVTFPTLFAGPRATGQPGQRVTVNVSVEDQDGATVSFENVTLTTSFGIFNFTLGAPFSFGPGVSLSNFTVSVPANLALGSYNLTIQITLWKYLNPQAQVWIPLRPVTVNQTMLVTNSPPPANPPNSPGPTPPSSGQGPSSANTTTVSLNSFLGIIRSAIIPVLGGYAILVTLAATLLIRHERRRSNSAPILKANICVHCGQELKQETWVCPNCSSSTNSISSLA